MKSLFFSLLFLTGCAVSSETYTADGKKGHMIDCSGSALTWGHCYSKAGDICGSLGYEVLAKDGNDGVSAVATGSTFALGSVIKRSLVIQCK